MDNSKYRIDEWRKQQLGKGMGKGSSLNGPQPIDTQPIDNNTLPELVYNSKLIKEMKNQPNSRTGADPPPFNFEVAIEYKPLIQNGEVPTNTHNTHLKKCDTFKKIKILNIKNELIYYLNKVDSLNELKDKIEKTFIGIEFAEISIFIKYTIIHFSYDTILKPKYKILLNDTLDILNHYGCNVIKCNGEIHKHEYSSFIPLEDVKYINNIPTYIDFFKKNHMFLLNFCENLHIITQNLTLNLIEYLVIYKNGDVKFTGEDKTFLNESLEKIKNVEIPINIDQIEPILNKVLIILIKYENDKNLRTMTYFKNRLSLALSMWALTTIATTAQNLISNNTKNNIDIEKWNKEIAVIVQNRDDEIKTEYEKLSALQIENNTHITSNMTKVQLKKFQNDKLGKIERDLAQYKRLKHNIINYNNTHYVFRQNIDDLTLLYDITKNEKVKTIIMEEFAIIHFKKKIISIEQESTDELLSIATSKSMIAKTMELSELVKKTLTEKALTEQKLNAGPSKNNSNRMKALINEHRRKIKSNKYAKMDRELLQRTDKYEKGLNQTKLNIIKRNKQIQKKRDEENAKRQTEKVALIKAEAPNHSSLSKGNVSGRVVARHGTMKKLKPKPRASARASARASEASANKQPNTSL